MNHGLGARLTLLVIGAAAASVSALGVASLVDPINSPLPNGVAQSMTTAGSVSAVICLVGYLILHQLHFPAALRLPRGPRKGRPRRGATPPPELRIGRGDSWS